MTDIATDPTTDPTAAAPADITTVVDAYFAMWNEDDAAERGRLIATAWAPEGAYADPLLTAVGHEALGEMVEAVHAQYPGARFRRTTAIDGHHGFHRFGWQLGEGDQLVVAGLDVAHTGDDGRLTGIAGFFGPLADEPA
ncbi:MAG TPA: nuclear transport factor 2 family protein [Aquihabitans sp.]|jgi:hypothetical protein|nr:nuclear transport factor 2 family protein [Aquihabitans sp.]